MAKLKLTSGQRLKLSTKVDKQNLKDLAKASLTWNAYNKRSKGLTQISDFYRDLLFYIRSGLVEYYETVKEGEPTRTDYYKALHFKKFEKGLVREIEKLGGKEDALGKRLIGEMVQDEFKNSAFQPLRRPVNLLKAIESKNWSVSQYSDRVWEHKGNLQKAITQELRYGLATGMPVGDLASKVQRITGNSEYNSYRLVRNEMAIAANHTKYYAYDKLGVEKVRIVTALDERTCITCSARAGDIVSLEEARDILPLHVMCRCTYVAVVDKMSDKGVTKRDRTQPQTIEVPQIEPPKFDITDNKSVSEETLIIPPAKNLPPNFTEALQDVKAFYSNQAFNDLEKFRNENDTVGGISHVEQYFKEKYLIGDLSQDIVNATGLKGEVYLRGHDIGYILFRHGADIEINEFDLLEKLVTDPTIIGVDERNKNTKGVLAYYPSRNGYLEGAITYYEGNYVTHFHYMSSKNKGTQPSPFSKKIGKIKVLLDKRP